MMVGGIFWSLTYVLIIRRGFKDKNGWDRCQQPSVLPVPANLAGFVPDAVSLCLYLCLRRDIPGHGVQEVQEGKDTALEKVLEDGYDSTGLLYISNMSIRS